MSLPTVTYGKTADVAPATEVDVSGDFSKRITADFGNGFVTTGKIQPGIIWLGNDFQVGVEEVIPVSGQSGNTIGVVGQLHLYLDDIFLTTVGQPLIGNATRLPFEG
jgi:hypothetical protein